MLNEVAEANVHVVHEDFEYRVTQQFARIAIDQNKK
jgi:hypothetical protein